MSKYRNKRCAPPPEGVNYKEHRKMCCIYSMVNIIDNKLYIGSTKDLYFRILRHFQYLRKKSHPNRYLQNAFNKYGENSFKVEILKELNIRCKNKTFLKEEWGYINKFRKSEPKSVYNLTECTSQNHFGVKGTGKNKKGTKHFKSKEYTLVRLIDGKIFKGKNLTSFCRRHKAYDMNNPKECGTMFKMVKEKYNNKKAHGFALIKNLNIFTLYKITSPRGNTYKTRDLFAFFKKHLKVTLTHKDYITTKRYFKKWKIQRL